MKEWLGILTIEAGGEWFHVLSGRLVIADFADKEDAELFVKARKLQAIREAIINAPDGPIVAIEDDVKPDVILEHGGEG